MKLEFKVASDSMAPLIKIGNLLQISSRNEYSKFDIILFKRYESLYVHFVWRNQVLFNNTIITRSLKNYLEDEEPVDIRDIVGVVSNYKIPLLIKIKIYVFCFLMRSK